MKAWGWWRYGSIDAEPLHYIKVSDQPQVTAYLSLGQQPTILHFFQRGLFHNLYYFMLDIK